jgi:hypothetical protein
MMKLESNKTFIKKVKKKFRNQNNEDKIEKYNTINLN